MLSEDFGVLLASIKKKHRLIFLGIEITRTVSKKKRKECETSTPVNRIKNRANAYTSSTFEMPQIMRIASHLATPNGLDAYLRKCICAWPGTNHCVHVNLMLMHDGIDHRRIACASRSRRNSPQVKRLLMQYCICTADDFYGNQKNNKTGIAAQFEYRKIECLHAMFVGGTGRVRHETDKLMPSGGHLMGFFSVSDLSALHASSNAHGHRLDCFSMHII